MGVFENDGLYSIFALTWMLLGFTALVLAALGYRRVLRIPVAPPTEGMLACALLFFVYISMFKLPGAYVVGELKFAKIFYLFHALVVASGCCAFFFVQRAPRWLKHAMLLMAVAIAVVLRCWMIGASPAPKIDVFSAATHAAQAFFETGKSPYAPDASGIIPFYYPPLNFYLHALSYKVTGDIRSIYVLAEIAVAGLLWWCGRRWIGSLRGLLLSCIFLFHPRALYMLELGWTEPPIVALLALAVALVVRERRGLAAAVYGSAVSLKQYLAFFLLHWFLLERRWSRFAIMIGAAAATAVPFLLVAPEHLLENGFLQTLRGGIRQDSLTFVTFIQQSLGVVLPKMTSLVVGCIVSVWTFRAFRREPAVPAFLFSSALTTFALFLFGAQGFANYYYVVFGIVLLLLAHHADEEETLSSAIDRRGA